MYVVLFPIPFLMSSVVMLYYILLSQNVSRPVIQCMMYKSFDEIKIRPKYFHNQTYSTHILQTHTHTHMHIQTDTHTYNGQKLYSSFLRYAACVLRHPLVPPLKYNIFIFCCINFIFGMFRGFPSAQRHIICTTSTL